MTNVNPTFHCFRNVVFLFKSLLPSTCNVIWKVSLSYLWSTLVFQIRNTPQLQVMKENVVLFLHWSSLSLSPYFFYYCFLDLKLCPCCFRCEWRSVTCQEMFVAVNNVRVQPSRTRSSVKLWEAGSWTVRSQIVFFRSCHRLVNDNKPGVYWESDLLLSIFPVVVIALL